LTSDVLDVIYIDEGKALPAITIKGLAKLP
jgi:hypothetical protein